MNDTLQNTLAELAQQLGTTSGQLWDWMQGEGIQAYARVEIAQSAVNVITSSVLLLLACVAISMLVHGLKNHVPTYSEDDDFWWLMGIAVVGSLSFFPVITICSQLPNLVGWLASPEGMVIKMLVERLS